jgi:hypothetical protein
MSTLMNAICLTALLVLTVACEQPTAQKPSPQTAAIDTATPLIVERETRIPSGAVKITTATDAHPPQVLSAEYKKPEPVPGAVNTAGAEDSPFITPDGNTLYFFFTPDVKIPAEKQLLDGVTGIYVSKKVAGQWGRPERIVLQEAGKRAGTWGEIASDTLSSRGYASLMREWLAAAHPQVVYVFTDWRMWPALFDVVEASGLPVRSMIVWNKGHPGLGALWRTQHELIMYAARQGNKVNQLARTAAKGNVINAARTGNDLHYTQKPVELLIEVLEGDAASGRDGPVFDPFAGCGSTLIACDALERACGTIEIEPRYADLICRRWGEQAAASAILEATGRTWTETANACGVDVSDLEPAPPPRCDPSPEELES